MNIKLKNKSYLQYLKNRFNLNGEDCEKRARYMEEFEDYLFRHNVNSIEDATICNTVNYLEYIKQTQGEAKARGHASIILECSEHLEIFELTFIAAFISDHDEYGLKLLENLSKHTKEEHGSDKHEKVFGGRPLPSPAMDDRIAYIRQTETEFAKAKGILAYKKACSAAFTMW